MNLPSWLWPAASMPLDAAVVLGNEKRFHSFIYTPLRTALKELERRRKHADLAERVRTVLGNDVPAPFSAAPRGVLFRQLATPNFEVRRFFNILESIDELTPLYFEYCSDKFTSNNLWKYYLGKLCFYKGKAQNGTAVQEYLKIIDFHASDGKRITEVKTTWGQSLIDFHHEFYRERFRDTPELFYDASAWLAAHGGTPIEYYKQFLALFVRDGILFENLVLKQERDFIERIFLPAMAYVEQETGYRPLIVELEPTEMEEDTFWMSHPAADKEFVARKMLQSS